MRLNKFITNCCALTLLMSLAVSVSAHDNVKVVVVPLGGDEAPTHKMLFVTSSLYNGDLETAGNGSDGPDGADKLCMQHAESTGSKVKGKIFKAWLSTGGVVTFNGSNREFVIHNLPYHNVNGQQVFNNLWHLNVVLPANLILTESGSTPTLDQRFPWSGIDAFGNFHPDSCTDWTSESGSVDGLYGGLAGSDAGDWTAFFVGGCGDPGSLLCFEQ